MIPRTLFSSDHDAFRDSARRFIIGGGTAEVMKQIIGNVLLPKMRKAN